MKGQTPQDSLGGMLSRDASGLSFTGDFKLHLSVILGETLGDNLLIMHLVKHWIHSFHLLILQMEFEIVTFPDLGLQLTVRVFNSFKSTQNHNKTYVSCTGMYTFQQNASLSRVFTRKKKKWNRVLQQAFGRRAAA